jgi:NADH:ubiquinone oxidoreductase subunit 3 (subunit A)
MVDQYLAVAIFAVVALLIPLSAMLFSKLVRIKSDSNDVKTKVYESAEETVGERVEPMHEYLHYFVAFLAFEMLSVIVIVWSTFTRQGLQGSGLYVIGLLVFGFVLEVFLFGISRSRVE